MLKRVTLPILVLGMLAIAASVPANAEVGFQVCVGPRTFVPPAHTYWYSYPARPYYYSYPRPYAGYPYAYYHSAPAYRYHNYKYRSDRHHDHRNHQWRQHHRRR